MGEKKEAATGERAGQHDFCSLLEKTDLGSFQLFQRKV